MKKLSQMTQSERNARIAKLVANPATRSAVPDKYLPAKYRQSRDLNTRLNAPVTQGSTLTNRDVARQANSAVQVKYGDAERQATQQIGVSQQTERDQSGWYDDYLKELAQHRGNVEQIGKDTVAGIQALGAAQPQTDVTGMSADNQVQGANAAAVRKAMIASFGATENARGANATSYADTLAHVVGPGQKLTAQAQGRGQTQKFRDQLLSLGKEKGAYREQVIGDATAAEQKNVLAQQALGLDVTKAATDAAAGRATRRETRQHNRAQETADAQKTKAKSGEVNQYGYTNADWQKLTTGERQKVIKDFKTTGGKTKSPYLGQGQQNTFQNTFTSTKAVVGKYQDQYSRQELSQLLLNGRAASTLYVDASGKQVDSKAPGARKVPIPAIPKITNAAALSAALDAVYDGHLSPVTIKKLHAQGIKVNPLGVSTKRPKKTVATTTTTTANPVLTPGGATPLGPVGIG